MNDYFMTRGFKARLTGEIRVIHGAEWYVGIILEGPRKGKEAVQMVNTYQDDNK